MVSCTDLRYSFEHSNVEENLILRDVFDQLGPGMRITQPSYDELCDMIGAGIQRLVSWNQKWNDETMGELAD